MTEGSDTERFLIFDWQVTARKNETGLSPVVWNINFLFSNFYVGQMTHLTTPRSAPDCKWHIKLSKECTPSVIFYNYNCVANSLDLNTLH